MKSKAVIIILVLACLGLAAALFFRHNNASKEKEVDSATILQLSNQWTQTKDTLTEQKQVNTTLESTLHERQEKLQKVSNELVQVSANLTKLEAESKAQALAAQAEMAKRDAKIAELESQKDDLTKRMGDLNGSISKLENQISDTERKLAASEGDRDFLLKELKRLQAEKAELERQFNDLAVLREQVHKLKDELSVTRRLDWIRRGIYGNMQLKGAERLNKGFTPPPVPGTNYNLNVELEQKGGVKINPPATNAAPAAKPATNAPAPPK
jgi:septal ring factor EnvC (AmiA/AmiB activator)